MPEYTGRTVLTRAMVLDDTPGLIQAIEEAWKFSCPTTAPLTVDREGLAAYVVGLMFDFLDLPSRGAGLHLYQLMILLHENQAVHRFANIEQLQASE